MVNDARYNNPFFRPNPETLEIVVHNEPGQEKLTVRYLPKREWDATVQEIDKDNMEK